MAHTKTPPKGKQKRTYVLTASTLERFEAQVPPGKRGAAIDEAIDLWFAEKRRREIHEEFEAFGRDEEAQALYAQIDKEWAPLSDEVWAAIDDDWSTMTADEMNEEFNAPNSSSL